MIVAVAKDADSGLYGFISPDGEWVIKPTFTQPPGDFHEGLAIYKEDGDRCGFIDTYGDMVIPANYKAHPWRGGVFSHGLAAVGALDTPFAGYIDINGKWVIEPKFFDPGSFLGEHASAGDEHTTFGVIDKAGNWHVNPRFASLSDFYEGLACGHESWHYSDDPRSGYVNESGEIVIEPSYGRGVEFEPFSEGRAKLTDTSTSLSIYIDKQGHPVSKFEVLAGGSYSEGLAQATDPYTNRVGFLGLDGTWAIYPDFYHVDDFHDGLAAAVESGGQSSGRVMFAGIPLLGSVAGMDGSLWGFINRQGDWVVPPSYAAMRHFGAGYAAVRYPDTGKWGVIDRYGHLTAEPRFEGVGHFHHTDM